MKRWEEKERKWMTEKQQMATDIRREANLETDTRRQNQIDDFEAKVRILWEEILSILLLQILEPNDT